ncbi:copper chaperone PCu(A)C [uncultured Aquincola sp.]|uniref:copper chaperone PCu(A)C n=1 Tax=uncultured Aquincola sp. TaxID=886556 RepID=UPI0032B1BBE1|tara:strand:- start:122 stop:622 length:501 start_codon:yes stop_codon:yes gene_type:complete
MTADRLGRRRTLAAVASVLLVPCMQPATAHDFKLGALRIDHPYATPTPAGVANGAAYLRGIRNTGGQADRLVGASTPAAARVEIHRSVLDADNVMRMRAVDGIDLPPKSEVQVRHGGEYHLMLIDLKRPLKDGDRFTITLRFEKAGEREVTAWVQTPRGQPEAHRH